MGIGKSRRIPASLRQVALRKLENLDAAQALADLAVPPGNSLKHCGVTAKASMRYESTISFGFASRGGTATLSAQKSWITTDHH